nr:hypothetical protein Iba_chr15aCG5660 [Ipomoea batatas]
MAAVPTTRDASIGSKQGPRAHFATHLVKARFLLHKVSPTGDFHATISPEMGSQTLLVENLGCLRNAGTCFAFLDCLPAVPG